MSPVPVLTIDGPSGSGKGTISAEVARRLGWHMLDSGALYRLTALAALRHQVSLDDVEGLAEIARTLEVEFLAQAQGPARIMLEGQPVSDELRTESCGNAASKVAAIPAVREALLQRQRDFQQAPGLVADGRDMGTVVFPQAAVKVFLTASAEERAQRRFKQLKEKGMDVNLPALLQEIAERDQRDSNRSVAPLKPAEDALVLDTTGMGIDEVVESVLQACKSFI